MDQSWFRRLFSRPATPASETTQDKADHGDAEAQFSLGSSFLEPGSSLPDYAKAIEWLSKAAGQNHAVAQFSLGTLFAEGQGVPRDENEGWRWIGRAAQQGHAAAQHSLGVRHRRASFQVLPERALESNLEAYKWFRLAAAQGRRDSNSELENLAIDMTQEQVVEGDQRADRFLAGPSAP